MKNRLGDMTEMNGWIRSCYLIFLYESGLISYYLINFESTNNFY